MVGRTNGHIRRCPYHCAILQLATLNFANLQLATLHFAILQLAAVAFRNGYILPQSQLAKWRNVQ